MSMKWLFIIIFLGCVYSVNAQTPTPETVTISKDAAIKCLENGDKVVALTTENKAQLQAIADLKDIINGLKMDLAKMSGEKTGAEQQVVRLTAIVDLLLKSVRPKKIGLINF